ncbi:polysaccharide lyase family 8 super-sandwich domain-containing protein [Photobacterium sanguinicancri]|uniref:polysaccharide lyase family 8 super-sandwich domain-containing protein n=1 Tax=Photobacterium sanguinicancri TaxID=875932 RepID=UPI001F155685|nr:polysaccharide lyase family 8 super-sandwich domain-containing protein [Photobacterium sanguinicancri]
MMLGLESLPGTTTIQMPNNELRAQLNQLPGAGIEEMLLSTESYSGANTLGNDNAMFAMTLHGHKKYQQQSFYAHKSYFIFGNKVVALGSGIKNDIAEHETQTTLFQHSVKNLEPVEIDGQQIDTLGTDSIYANDTTLLDPAGNRYFVTSSAGQQVHFTYQMQQSNDEDDAAPTTGQFATAVIEHGKAPTNGSYEYAIKIAAQDAVKPIYTVLQKDQNLHAVRTEQGVEGYAFFSPTPTNQAGWVLSSASASQIMLQASPAQDQLSLSVVNPDLALYQGQDPDQVDANGEQVEVSIYDRDWRFNLSQPVISEFTLKGQWQLTGSNSQVSVQSASKENTTIRVTTKDAKPKKFMLKKV